jgi:1-acyl-sn-glycerol-3-phosphate acyltransferase
MTRRDDQTGRAGRAFARCWYTAIWCGCWAISMAWFRFQYSGRRHVPKSGPIILLSNHQSNLDPVLVGVACPRQLRYLAKKSLFFWPLSWWIRALGAVPIDLEGSAISGLKTMLRLLKQGEAVLMFPEGSRTLNGRLQPLLAGFCPLARRSGAAIVPVAVDGAFAALRAGARFPRPVRITLQIGPPILRDEIADLTDDELVALAAARIAALMPETRAR